ncbi:MAG: hypothetical protein V3T23_04190 [Nitrososphaerales archaeon]
MAERTNRSDFLRTLIRGIVFVVAAIPGVLIFVVSLAVLLLAPFVPYGTGGSNFWLLLLGPPVGGVLILLGIGDFRKWPCLFVFVSIPVLGLCFGWLTDVLGWDGKGEFMILVGIASYLIFRKIDKYYKATRELRQMNLEP